MVTAALANKRDRRTLLEPLEGLKIVEELTAIVLADEVPGRAAGILAAQARWREILATRKILQIVAAMITGKFLQALKDNGLTVVKAGGEVTINEDVQV